MTELLLHEFVQNALIAGLIVSFLCSSFGVFVVQRRMSFLGDGLAHVAFGGVALGLLLQFEPFWISIPFTVIIAIALTYLKENSTLEIDTAIGIFFAISVALGILFISLNKRYVSDAFSYLFGSILLVSKNDLLYTLVFLLIALIIFLFWWERWTYSTFDYELAKVDKINVEFDNYLLSVLIAITIVVSIKLVGILLVASYLVIPAATAKLISKTFSQMTIFSLIFGVISSELGILLSIIFNLPSGAFIVLFQASIFILILFLKFLFKAN